MNGHMDGNRMGFNATSAATLRIGLFIAGIVLLGTIEFLETDTLFAGIQFEEIFIFRLTGYANLVLVGSTVLYFGHMWSGSESVGRWASGMALLGSSTSIVALVWRWIETYYLHRLGHIPLNSLYEMMSLFSAMTVLIYLVMEHVYRTRAAGAFVMLIVFGAVVFQVWLVANDQAIPGAHVRVLKSYWMYAHVLGSFFGYGAFAVAAAMGAAYLVRARAESLGRSTGFAVQSLPELRSIDGLMHRAIVVGFPLFGLATVLGSVWSYEAWGRYWAWEPKETWALLVCLTYGSYFYCRWVNKLHGRSMAWWTIAGFAITVFCFLGTRMLEPGLHAIGRAIS
jgi:cytochrome c-type biogenesis protein CcsB